LQKAYAILRVNPRDGLERLEKLAGAGSTASMLYLGDAYYHGMGVKKDIKLATHWYEMADQRNSREAAYILGRIYTDSNDIDAAFSAYSRGVARESPNGARQFTDL
jgi:TPR repeat protein